MKMTARCRPAPFPVFKAKLRQRSAKTRRALLEQLMFMRAATRARGVTSRASIAAYPHAHSLSSSAWRAPRVSRRAAAASEAVVERVLAEHMRPGVTNLAPGTASWRPPVELMPPPAAEDNFFYGACHGEPALLDALRTKREVEDGVDL